MNKNALGMIRRMGNGRFAKHIACGTLAALLSTVSIASASVSTPGSPTFIEYFGSAIGGVSASGGTVQIALSGSSAPFYGAVSAQAACTANNQTLDTIKLWTSMGQAALLSGKQLKIYYTACGGINYINGMDIIQ